MAKREDKREQIMRAAEKLFTSLRFHEITLDQVAEQAKVGKGTIYLYFQDKDDLFFQTATAGFDELCQILQQNVPGDVPFAQQLLVACRHIVAFFERRRQLLRMMQTEEGRIPWCKGTLRQRWLERRKKLLAAVAQIVERGVAEGQVRRDIPPDVLASFLLGMLRARARDMGDVPEALRGVEVVVDLFCRGAAGDSRQA